MELGNNVTMSWDCRLLTPLIWLPSDDSKLTLRIDDNVSLGRRCTISAANRVLIGSNVLVGPNVLIVDHNHNYKDIHRPIRQQGWSRNGYIVIEQNCWIGANVVIIGSKGITIGQGSVIGANTVVTKSVPKFSVVAGNPCKILSHYDESAQQWVSAGELV
jgi:acetyltransferase-like isoleucine patch superfamily enzyme